MPSLYPEQEIACQWIFDHVESRKYKGAVLGDRMGVYGKTAPAICAGAALPGAKLYIVPAYTLYNWILEFEMWGVLASDICVIDARDQILEDKPFYLIAYSRVRHECYTTPSGDEKKRLNGVMRQLFKKHFSLIVCDEGHRLAGWNTQQSRYILGNYQNKNNNLISRADFVLLLTGTLFKNRIEELYNVIIRLAPEVLDHMTKLEFYQRYAERIEYSPFGIKAHGSRNEADLKKRLAPILLRRTSSPHVKEPEIETVILDPRSSALQKLFKEEEAFLLSCGVAPDDVQGITKLSKVEIQEIAEVRAKIAVTKIPSMLEMIGGILEEQETPSPIAICCYYRDTLVAVKKAVSTKYPKLRAAYIDGGVPVKKRHEIVQVFQAGNIDVLCSTLGALQEGVNLVRGHDVIMIEGDYVPANMDQYICRFARNGQKETVRVRRLVYNAGIEKRILRILAEKSTTIEKIMGK